MAKKPPAPQTDHIKAFLKIVEGFRYRHNVYEVFRDFTELAAAAVHNMPYTSGMIPKDEAYKREEAAYMAVAKRYNAEELSRFSEMLAITKAALDAERQDFLGVVYMQLEIGNERAGQFFTPYEVSLMMAKMTLDVETLLGDKGFITVQEPAVGAGGMLIAAAQVIEESGRDYSRVMYFDATDVDRQCCNMTLIQCGLLGMTGVVHHGNSLTLEQIGYRFTPLARLYAARTNRMIAHLEGDDRSEEQQPTPVDAAPAQKPDEALRSLATPPRNQLAFDF